MSAVTDAIKVMDKAKNEIYRLRAERDALALRVKELEELVDDVVDCTTFKEIYPELRARLLAKGKQQ